MTYERHGRLTKQDLVFEQQADAAISQANPVSTTLYTVLDTTKNVRILSISAKITWAVTQPTPLEVLITIDGNTIIHLIANPTTAQDYIAKKTVHTNEANQELLAMSGGTASELVSSTLYEGRSVKVQARVTWATTQPTPLVCRVKYAKIP